MTEASPRQHLRACIQKVATGPEYSKDLSYEEALLAMRHVLEPEVDPVQAAIYLIALRMKRETDEENRGTLQALLEQADSVTAAVDEVVDVSDPYDGFVRCTPASTFVPAVLACLGVPAVLHGLNAVGPKFGATHHKVLAAAGVDTGLLCADAAAQLAQCGWTYVDQAQFAPYLHGLIPLRQRMVKRQVLTTVETLLAPVRGQHKTHYMGGYVHKAYPEIYASLARHAGFSSAMFIRGVEGGIVPSLQQSGKLFFYQEDGVLQQRDLLPEALGIQASVRAVPLPEVLPEPPRADPDLPVTVDSGALAAHAARLGLAALSGERGLTYDSLVYAASICLTHLGRHATLAQAAAAVRAVLDNGSALAAFRAVA
ncbi:MAG: anthranilate phosphoribosyltransferase [Thiothrix sp.]|nr:anthranilate phosphoribosyltransferase [Thiothrix sp.]